ncbi:hypothetical protein [Ligilactobacillus acidipiscis]|uniref:hypothetical protein n=1 Tax=Ligilactobacillus acidipiscis TaxID=89059 RepID=UPI000A246696|nr:hypothetical protein [Ligilactobacillus acidipiscis]GAW63337.1 hypothetical protein Lacidipiscis_00520 [Ligilactobacillus acidipiscis]GEN21707.1 hypothetical protein LAC02_49880 [Ligilactobacillus acidipiscis]
MFTMEFLQYLNLALKQSDLMDEQQDQIWIDTKILLDERTLEEVQELLAET